MIPFFTDFMLKSTYQSVYGNKARVTLKDDVVEVVVGNKKVVYNKANGNKKEESFYDDNKVTLTKYSDIGMAEIEEIYSDGVKISERRIGSDKDVSKDLTLNGIDKTTSTYMENGSKIVEDTYLYKDGDNLLEYFVRTKENSLIEKRNTQEAKRYYCF